MTERNSGVLRPNAPALEARAKFLEVLPIHHQLW